jgi:hypothetical protein
MFKMMTMLISDLGEHEGTIYKHGWTQALGFSSVALCSSHVSLMKCLMDKGFQHGVMDINA